MTATDAAGNQTIRSFTITVRDTTAPVISGITSLISVTATSAAGAVVTFPAITALDTVSGSVTPAFSHASGSVFAIGFTLVTVTATDLAGNVSTRTFWVWVHD